MESKLRKLGQWVLVGATYFFLGKLGLLLAVVQSNATAIWAPTGVAIAALLFFGYDVWPAIFFAAFITNVTTGGTSVLVSLLIAAGNTLEGISAAYLVRTFANGVRAFSHSRDVLRFFLFAGAASPVISATVGVTSLTLFGYSSWSNYIPTWTTWWVGDLSGAVIFAPLLLLWLIDRKITWSPARIPRLLFIAALVVASGILILTNSIVFLYLSIPLFVWTAFHLKQRETAVGAFILTEISLWGTLRGYGPFIRYEAGSLNASLLLLDAAMVSMTVTMMVLASAVEEDREIKKSLAEERIADRAALVSVGEGLILTNHELNIMFVNPAAEMMLGAAASELMGKNYFEAIAMQREDGSSIPTAERALSTAVAENRRVTNNPFGTLEYYVKKMGSASPSRTR
jgi:integral membrane sensor domain MASE1